MPAKQKEDYGFLESSTSRKRHKPNVVTAASPPRAYNTLESYQQTIRERVKNFSTLLQELEEQGEEAKQQNQKVIALLSSSVAMLKPFTESNLGSLSNEHTAKLFSAEKRTKKIEDWLAVNRGKLGSNTPPNSTTPRGSPASSQNSNRSTPSKSPNYMAKQENRIARQKKEAEAVRIILRDKTMTPMERFKHIFARQSSDTLRISATKVSLITAYMTDPLIGQARGFSVLDVIEQEFSKIKSLPFSKVLERSFTEGKDGVRKYHLRITGQPALPSLIITIRDLELYSQQYRSGNPAANDAASWELSRSVISTQNVKAQELNTSISNLMLKTLQKTTEQSLFNWVTTWAGVSLQAAESQKKKRGRKRAR